MVDLLTSKQGCKDTSKKEYKGAYQNIGYDQVGWNEDGRNRKVAGWTRLFVVIGNAPLRYGTGFSWR